MNKPVSHLRNDIRFSPTYQVNILLNRLISQIPFLPRAPPKLPYKFYFELGSSMLYRDAQIAIGVLVPVVVIAIATAAGFYIFFRRRLAKRLEAGRAPVPDAYMLGTLPPK